ncbi:MAG: TnpV protein [Oscillospiraceae bacterium]|nr:TnpV protein [Oscillospiraceae bacterium]
MIPNLTLSPEESAVRLGKWGMLHKDYLQKHNRVELVPRYGVARIHSV